MTVEWKIIDEIKVEGRQKFIQYTKITPILVEIFGTEFQNKLRFYSKRFKFRFIADSLLFSPSIQNESNVIFLSVNGLNEAKYILINCKLYQVIGQINLSEIENWDKIQTTAWINAKLNNSEYLLNAKHFALAFETRDLNNLFSFEYSLLNQKGELIQFSDKNKIPAINFTIQVVY